MYYKGEDDDDFRPFNFGGMPSEADTFDVSENVVFPDNIFAAILVIEIYRNPHAPAQEPMEFKLSVYACFEKGKSWKSDVSALIHILFYSIIVYNSLM